MKYLMLVRAGLLRKKARTILTTLSIIVAFLLFRTVAGHQSNDQGGLRRR